LDTIPLNPRLHGKSRVPGQKAPAFDLNAFSQALEQCDVNYQLARYAPDANIRIVDPNHPPAAPRTVRGAQAIHAWLLDATARNLDLHVTHLVDGADRVAFTACWHYEDGTDVVATSTAELHNGLITTQLTILAWRAVGVDRVRELSAAGGGDGHPDARYQRLGGDPQAAGVQPADRGGGVVTAPGDREERTRACPGGRVGVHPQGRPPGGDDRHVESAKPGRMKVAPSLLGAGSPSPERGTDA
jgi:hypothetical protein